ncbi:MAG: hypothetical protein O7C72_07320, partial [Deltaproteobacteria bacterium]|nr:hypothetical protein [Deltaproteobacteria bacterium]
HPPPPARPTDPTRREDLIREISDLLTDPKKGRKMGELAAQVVGRDSGVVERSMALISRYITQE